MLPPNGLSTLRPRTTSPTPYTSATDPAPGGASQPASPAKNRIGLTAADYKGSKSTLCPGCGHDAITNSIVTAAFEMGLDPHRLA